MKILYVCMAAVLMLTACSGQPESQDRQRNDQTGQNEQPEGAANEEPLGEKHEKQGEDSVNEEQHEQGKQSDPKYKMTDDYDLEPLGDADPKVVLLTIDDAPEDHALDMARTLKQLDAPAIFFVNGMYLKSKKDRKKLEEIHDMGFMIGNHTMTHPDLSQLSKEEQRKEISPLYEQIQDITGERVKFFRAPHGVNTDVSDRLAKQQGALVMNWSYGYDFKEPYMETDALTRIMLEPDPPALLHNGAILLMHDREWTAEALEDIVKGLREQGYRILDPALVKTPDESKHS